MSHSPPLLSTGPAIAVSFMGNYNSFLTGHACIAPSAAPPHIPHHHPLPDYFKHKSQSNSFETKVKSYHSAQRRPKAPHFTESKGLLRAEALRHHVIWPITSLTRSPGILCLAYSVPAVP